jgi:hypothetical protein
MIKLNWQVLYNCVVVSELNWSVLGPGFDTK